MCDPCVTQPTLKRKSMMSLMLNIVSAVSSRLLSHGTNVLSFEAHLDFGYGCCLSVD